MGQWTNYMEGKGLLGNLIIAQIVKIFLCIAASANQLEDALEYLRKLSEEIVLKIEIRSTDCILLVFCPVNCSFTSMHACMCACVRVCGGILTFILVFLSVGTFVCQDAFVTGMVCRGSIFR
jgi:hypothetical protein